MLTLYRLQRKYTGTINFVIHSGNNITHIARAIEDQVCDLSKVLTNHVG